MNNKWVIGIDMDGTTLMSYDGRVGENGRRIDRVHPITKEAIKQLTELGHYVVINTGRNWYEAEPNYKDLELKSYISNSAGSHIHNPSNEEEPQFIDSIPNETIKEILNDEYIMKNVEGWTVDNINDTYMIEWTKGKLKDLGSIAWNVTLFNGEFDFGVQSSVIYFNRPQEEVSNVVEYMREKWGDIVHTTHWGTTGGHEGGVELNPAKSNKGSALLKIAEQLGVPKENTMGIGDGENDLELIKMAEHGVCMSNGVDYIKKHSQHVTKFDNNEGGVGIFLKEFFNLD